MVLDRKQMRCRQALTSERRTEYEGLKDPAKLADNGDGTRWNRPSAGFCCRGSELAAISGYATDAGGSSGPGWVVGTRCFGTACVGRLRFAPKRSSLELSDEDRPDYGLGRRRYCPSSRRKRSRGIRVWPWTRSYSGAYSPGSVFETASCVRGPVSPRDWRLASR